MGPGEQRSVTPGLVIADYIIDVQLGRGGMAEVWRGRRVSTGEVVAVKILLARYSGDAAIRMRFEREGEIRIEHPNIVNIQDFVLFGDRPAIIMRYYPNGSLENRLRPTGFSPQPLPLADVWRISDQVLSALDYAHSTHGVIHRDVKPANILLDDDGNAYLADFGIALDMKRYNLTRVGGDLGTPAYMSPEQIKHPGRVTHLADVYSFAIVLFEMLAARTPFESEQSVPDSNEAYEIQQGHIKRHPPHPRTLNKNVPRLLDAIVMWGLAKQEARRLPGCRTFRESLNITRGGFSLKKALYMMQIQWYLHAPGAFQTRRPVLKYGLAAAALLALFVFLASGSRDSVSLTGWAQSLLQRRSTASANADNAVTSAGNPRKRALLVGVDRYKSPKIPVLGAAANDLTSMREILVRNFDFAPANVLVLKDEQATHAGILEAIRKHLIQGLSRDDIAVFYFTGHGSQTPDLDGDEPDGMDETLVPYDSRTGTGRDITDDELNSMMSQVAAKTKNLTVILDSCHSGTGLKDATLAAKEIPAEEGPKQKAHPPAASRPEDRGGFNTSDFRYALIAASREKEAAFVSSIGGTTHSVLTYYLSEALRRTNLKTYRDVMDVVMATVYSRYGNQNPQLEGSNADQVVFGDTSRIPKPYFTVTRGNSNVVTLNGGQVHGITPGSVFRVYSPGAKTLAPPEQPLGVLTVTAVSPFECKAEARAAKAIPDGSRAVEEQHRFDDARLRVFLTGPPDSSALKGIREELANTKYIELVRDPLRCHVQVRERSGRLETLTAGGYTLSTPLAVGSSNTPARLSQQLKQWAQWFNLLQVHDMGDGPALEFNLVTKRPQSTTPISGLIGKPASALRPDDRVELHLRNTSNTDVYVTVVDMESTGTIQIAFPSEGAAELVKAGAEVTHGRIMDVPPGRTFVTDTFKVFASTSPIDFRPLARQGIKSVEETKTSESILDDLLGADSGAKGSHDPLRPGEWTTAQKAVLVRRQ